MPNPQLNPQAIDICTIIGDNLGFIPENTVCIAQLQADAPPTAHNATTTQSTTPQSATHQSTTLTALYTVPLHAVDSYVDFFQKAHAFNYTQRSLADSAEQSRNAQALRYFIIYVVADDDHHTSAQDIINITHSIHTTYTEAGIVGVFSTPALATAGPIHCIFAADATIGTANTTYTLGEINPVERAQDPYTNTPNTAAHALPGVETPTIDAYTRLPDTVPFSPNDPHIADTYQAITHTLRDQYLWAMDGLRCENPAATHGDEVNNATDTTVTTDKRVHYSFDPALYTSLPKRIDNAIAQITSRDNNAWYYRFDDGNLSTHYGEILGCVAAAGLPVDPVLQLRAAAQTIASYAAYDVNSTQLTATLAHLIVNPMILELDDDIDRGYHVRDIEYAPSLRWVPNAVLHMQMLNITIDCLSRLFTVKADSSSNYTWQLRNLDNAALYDTIAHCVNVTREFHTLQTAQFTTPPVLFQQLQALCAALTTTTPDTARTQCSEFAEQLTAATNSN